ncbi:unnamed protein product [Meloidogyne enterolobii]|uniref:Uncharacterized protein n=1 Tax=Meloidogyne enterolobii TaxID=390850 RepID=A0ACB0Z9T5_MELEN
MRLSLSFCRLLYLLFCTSINQDIFRFPTIFWVPKNDKENPVPYQGGREVNDFIKFIAEHATDPLKGYGRDGKKKKAKKADDKKPSDEL